MQPFKHPGDLDHPGTPARAARRLGLLFATASALAIAGAASAQCVVNPTTPYTNTGALNCLVFDDGAAHTGDVTNAASGTITSSTIDGVSVYANTTISGSIVNNGTITIAESMPSLRLKGLLIQSATVGVNLVNTGNVTASDLDVELINATIGGAINNSGNLTGTSTGGSGGIGIIDSDINTSSAQNSTVVRGGIFNASAGVITGPSAGVFIDGSSFNSAGTIIDGGIVNDGNMTATSIGYGLYISGNAGNLAAGGAAVVNGGITNNGNITGGLGGIGIAGGTVTGGIVNTGLVAGVLEGLQAVDASISGDIDNTASGTIGATQGPVIDVSAETLILSSVATGATSTIVGNTTIQGNIVNAGALVVPKAAEGIYLSGTGTVTVTVTGNIVNSGIIDSLSSAATGTIGIDVAQQATLQGQVLNSGNLDTSVGIEVDGGAVVGGIVNTGAVNVGGEGYAIALQGNAVVSGGITNNGAMGGAAGGIGIFSSTLTGGLLNTGSIVGGTVGIEVTDASITGDIYNTATGGIESVNGSAIVI
ncbi:MAG TPA: hypothetical protein VHW60_01560, partial [Caulobacteraceae bacterium]|nr:hypothetical protein [Caulobacteraceae bacterium]